MSNSTVPAAHDVLVPETLLKKRKSDAKAREEKAAKAAETKKVSIPSSQQEASQLEGNVLKHRKQRSIAEGI